MRRRLVLLAGGRASSGPPGGGSPDSAPWVPVLIETNRAVPAPDLPANLKISPAAVIDPDAAPIKTPTAALPA